jgi:hypothetical protein
MSFFFSFSFFFFSFLRTLQFREVVLDQFRAKSGQRRQDISKAVEDKLGAGKMVQAHFTTTMKELAVSKHNLWVLKPGELDISSE